MLRQHAKGQELIKAHKRQQIQWHAKYDDCLVASTNPKLNITLEQFLWAMEVVHSRAFATNFGIGGGSEALLSSQQTSTVKVLTKQLGVPIAFGLAGLAYFVSTPFPDNNIFNALGAGLVLSVVATSNSLNVPGLIKNEKNDGTTESNNNNRVYALLPLIDSANHDNRADSVIEFNPLTQCVELSIGPNCIINEGSSNNNNESQSQSQCSPQRQLCVSYGSNKSDTEWLINYGFLPSLQRQQNNDNIDDNNNDDDNDTVIRRRLAKAYLARNE